jgi:uncharacterized FAD-dependent dehydrogenase
MKLIINNIVLPLESDIDLLKKIVAKKLNVDMNSFQEYRIIKESVDARKKNNIKLIYSIMVGLENKYKIPSDADIKEFENKKMTAPVSGNKEINGRPVIVGTGPAGLFAALTLAQCGYNPLVIERGDPVEKRTEAVRRYWNEGVLDPESNVQFGEGGAGTFSDGKLTTRINDPLCEMVFDILHASGIESEVLYKAKPHIGTDKLKDVVIDIRKKIIKYGGEFRFGTKLTSLKINDGKLSGIVVNDNETITTDVAVLAIGHSARDTIASLFNNGLSMIQKPFSMGLRIEHPQEMIDASQYGKFAGHPGLGAADYHLFYKTGERTVYTFCMCPGGFVVASASEADTIVTNGMSEFARDQKNANSALVVSVNPTDFGNDHPLSGIELQRELEHLAFKTGGSDNSAPVQRLKDFIDSNNSGKIGIVKPSYTGKTKITDLNSCLPDFIKLPMKESISYFDKKLRGFGMNDALLTGVETRTSSPVRICRNEMLQAEGVEGLYLAGEGAGYAGGIVSAAVDGIKVAHKIIETYGAFD